MNGVNVKLDILQISKKNKIGKLINVDNEEDTIRLLTDPISTNYCYIVTNNKFYNISIKKLEHAIAAIKR